MKVLNIMSCSFKRYEESMPEKGILINEGKLIIDMKGEVVADSVWTYHQQPHEFCLNLKD